MEESFTRRKWSPNPNPNLFRHGDRFQERPKQQRRRRPPSNRKVFSIPIHFLESVAESKRKDSAAVKIQKVFRGALARENLKTLMRFEKEVDEIEMTIERDEGLIRRDGRERIRINEMLMAVLFRLDSVRGVRDYRKKVIRRVILLQESLDSLSAVRSDRQPLEESMEDREAAEEFMEDQETLEVPEPKETPVGAEKKATWMDEEEGDWSIVEALEIEESGAKGPEPQKVESGAKGSELKGVIGRIAEDNRKLKELVSVLCKRSSLQCSLVGGLAKRVEHLEKTMERRRKKKKTMEANTGLASENSMGGQ